MKNTVIALFVVILLPLFSVIGQERIDVIHLKNGDILKGIIIENVLNDYIKIELPGGSIFTVKYADILKFSKERPSTNSQILQRPHQPEPTGQPDFQKMMYYEKEKKSSATAVLLSLVITSAGHAYAGNWGRGLMFTAGRIGGVVLALSDGIQTKTSYYYSYSYETTEITAWYWIGLGTSLIFAILEAIDASAEVDRYNEDLYDKIIGKKPFSLNIVPSKNGPQLQLSYSF